MRQPTLTLAFLALFAASPAMAQKFNVDVGSVLGVPTSSYGAAAAQPGFWNQMPDGFGTALFDLGGVATGASVSALGANFAFWSNNPGTFGDDQELLDDACDGARIYTFTGLTPGTYTVYTYAWAPDNSNYQTLVAVQGSGDPDQTVGGSWSGAHQLGVTYARHTVAVPAGDIQITVTAAAGFATVNGFQLVDNGGGGCPLPQTYCTATVNSLGCPAVLGSSGVPSASAGSGFTVSYGPVPGVNVGLFIYTTTGAASTPIQTSFGLLCIDSPFKRGPGASAGGTAGTCTGNYSTDFNQFFATQTNDPSLIAGATVDLQFWHRDPPNPGGADLSNAIHFTMCP